MVNVERCCVGFLFVFTRRGLEMLELTLLQFGLDCDGDCAKTDIAMTI